MKYKIYTDVGVFELKKIDGIGFFDFDLCGKKIAIDEDIVKNLKKGELFLDLPILKIKAV